MLAEGQRLTAARLLQLVWADHTEDVGVGAVQTAVSRLRTWLGRFADPDVVLDYDGYGYRLRVRRDAIDLGRFRDMVENGDVAGALMARRGPVVSDAVRVNRSDSLVLALDHDVRAAALAWAEMSLTHGVRGAELARFEALAQDFPLDEPLQAARMRLLAADGRPAEALRLFQGLRHQLVEELGVEPGPLVQDAFSAVLGQDRGVEPNLRPLPVPAQLPPAAAGFVGRRDSAAHVLEALARGRLPVIVGMGGIGKTALAVHAANRVKDDFPDGQLYVDLRGAEDKPAEPRTVLAGFLRALGIDPVQIPDGLADRAALYRSVLSGRRMLVVLDNAADEQQVRPLLPGDATTSAGAAAMVTSRSALTALDGSEIVDLSVLPPVAAMALLSQVIGADRVAAEESEASEILQSCGHIPLAVRIVGARLAGRRTWSLARMAGMLRDERDRLDQLRAGDLAVRASLALSADRLPQQTLRVFRLLGLLDVPDFPAWAAAAVADLGTGEAEQHLERLVDAHLLEVAGAEPRLRYRFHDLVRLYARERCAREDGAAEQDAALVRAVGGWLWLAERAADRTPGPCYAPIHGRAPRWRHPRGAAALPVDTLTWFDAEKPALSAITRQACALGMVEAAWDLAAAQEKHCDVRRLHDDWHATNTLVRQACEAAGDKLGAAVLTRGLIEVTTWTVPDDGAQTMVALQERSAALLRSFEEVGEVRGMADALVMIAWGLVAQGRIGEALEAAQTALTRAAETDHLGGQARAHQIIAIAHSDGDPAKSVEHLRLALDFARKLGNARFEATAMQFLGAAYCRVGQGDLGHELLTRSLAVARAFDDSYTEAFSLLYLAKFYVASGDGRARAAAETAAAISRRNTMGHHLADALHVLGELDLAAGDVDSAVARLEESVALWQTRGWGSFLAEAEDALARAYAAADSSRAVRRSVSDR